MMDERLRTICQWWVSGVLDDRAKNDVYTVAEIGVRFYSKEHGAPLLPVMDVEILTEDEATVLRSYRATDEDNQERMTLIAQREIERMQTRANQRRAELRVT